MVADLAAFMHSNLEVEWYDWLQTMSPAFSQADMTLQHVTWWSWCHMYVLCQHFPTKRNHTKPTGELWDAVDFTQQNLLKIASPVAAFLRILSGCAFDLSNSWEKLGTMRSGSEKNTSLPVVFDWLLLVDWIVTSCQSSKHAIASCHRKSRPSRLICACKKAPYDVRFTSILVWYCQSFTKIV